HDYEMFTMNENEDIKSMFSRFTNIINALQALDKTYSNNEMVRKTLMCLPKSWMPKAFKKYPQKEKSSKKEELIFFECKKLGHFKSDCPSLKKKEQFKKSNEHSKIKKVMVATWDDNDESSSDEESIGKVADIAFTAIEEEDEDEVNFAFDKLQDAYENLFNEYKNVCLKNKSLKKNAISMSKE
ncbi:UBN2 domain-containing protein, partial [Cephalotus follicularis]